MQKHLLVIWLLSCDGVAHADPLGSGLPLIDNADAKVKTGTTSIVTQWSFNAGANAGSLVFHAFAWTVRGGKKLSPPLTFLAFTTQHPPAAWLDVGSITLHVGNRKMQLGAFANGPKGEETVTAFITPGELRQLAKAGTFRVTINKAAFQFARPQTEGLRALAARLNSQPGKKQATRVRSE